MSYDAAGAVKYVYFTDAVSAGEHVIQAVNNGGAMSLYLDGVSMAVTTVAIGTGIVAAHPATGYVGEKSDGTLQWNGEIKAARICKGSNPLACIP
jgi:hypothetical protein